jgi:hypothetical protein
MRPGFNLQHPSSSKKKKRHKKERKKENMNGNEKR